MANTCPQCKSDKVVTGSYKQAVGYRYDYGGGLIFRPHKQRILMRMLSPNLHVSDPIYACVECGLVWSRVDPARLKEAIAIAGKAELKQPLGL